MPLSWILSECEEQRQTVFPWLYFKKRDNPLIPSIDSLDISREWNIIVLNPTAKSILSGKSSVAFRVF